jgi:hypothetical protein
MKKFGGLLLLATALALPLGCIRSTRVQVRRTGEAQEADVARRWHGLTIGPCGFAGGSHANYSIRLNGPGPVFPVEQVEVLDEKGKVMEDAKKGLTGKVRVDSTRRWVTINLYRSNLPFEINGSYRYREP